MATANHLQARAEKQYYAGFSGDLDLFLDLSSLASPWEMFLEDLARIRTEFWWASEVAFCSIQRQILENFAKDDVRLYRRAETSEKWRDATRGNLRRCITELRKRIAELSSV
jgi:predicted metal-dependent HD superfamily phosphohydrolase